MPIISVVALIALDQLTKYLAVLYLQPVGTMPFIPGIMELRFVLNDGAAFSMFSGNRWFLIGFTSLALIGVAWYLFVKKPANKWETISLVLILAGGIGNLIDRIANGYVVDFFATTFMNFAVFNVADCFVVVGVIVLFLAVVIDETKKSRENSLKANNNEQEKQNDES